MENVLEKKNVKPKSIIVDPEIHSRFKVFCKGKNFKIGGAIEDLMLAYIAEPRVVREIIDKLKDIDG